jgi:sulfur carrier protein ThiS
MKMPILLFGPHANAAQSHSIDVVLPDGRQPSAEQVKTLLAEQYPALSGMLSAALIAVNHQAVRPEHVICETDELALVGLVSGG